MRSNHGLRYPQFFVAQSKLLPVVTKTMHLDKSYQLVWIEKMVWICEGYLRMLRHLVTSFREERGDHLDPVTPL